MATCAAKELDENSHAAKVRTSHAARALTGHESKALTSRVAKALTSRESKLVNGLYPHRQPRLARQNSLRLPRYAIPNRGQSSHSARLPKSSRLRKSFSCA